MTKSTKQFLTCEISGKKIPYAGTGRKPRFHASVTAKQRKAYKAVKAPVSAQIADTSKPEPEAASDFISRDTVEAAFMELCEKARSQGGKHALNRFNSIVVGIKAALNVTALGNIKPHQFMMATTLFGLNAQAW